MVLGLSVSMRQGPSLAPSGLPSRLSASSISRFVKSGSNSASAKTTFVVVTRLDKECFSEARPSPGAAELNPGKDTTGRDRHAFQLRRRVEVLGVNGYVWQRRDLRRR